MGEIVFFVLLRTASSTCFKIIDIFIDSDYKEHADEDTVKATEYDSKNRDVL